MSEPIMTPERERRPQLGEGGRQSPEVRALMEPRVRNCRAAVPRKGARALERAKVN